VNREKQLRGTEKLLIDSNSASKKLATVTCW